MTWRFNFSLFISSQQDLGKFQKYWMSVPNFENVDCRTMILNFLLTFHIQFLLIKKPTKCFFICKTTTKDIKKKVFCISAVPTYPNLRLGFLPEILEKIWIPKKRSFSISWFRCNEKKNEKLSISTHQAHLGLGFDTYEISFFLQKISYVPDVYTFSSYKEY